MRHITFLLVFLFQCRCSSAAFNASEFSTDKNICYRPVSTSQLESYIQNYTRSTRCIFNGTKTAYAETWCFLDNTMSNESATSGVDRSNSTTVDIFKMTSFRLWADCLRSEFNITGMPNLTLEWYVPVSQNDISELYEDFTAKGYIITYISTVTYNADLFCSYGFTKYDNDCVKDIEEENNNRVYEFYVNFPYGDITTKIDKLKLDIYHLILTQNPRFAQIKSLQIFEPQFLDALNLDGGKLLKMLQQERRFSSIVPTLGPGHTYPNGSVCAHLDFYTIIKEFNRTCLTVSKSITSIPAEIYYFCLGPQEGITHVTISRHGYWKRAQWSAVHGWKEYTSETVSKVLGICAQFYHTRNQNCLMGVLNVSYHLTSAYKTLVINDTGRTYEVDSYLPLENGIAVCYEADSSSSTSVLTGQIASTITNIGLPTSCVCLLWIIYVLVAHKTLHNLSNYCITALCVTVFSSDLIFFLSLHLSMSAAVCRNVAIATHWLMLHAYFWSIVIPFETLTMFKSSKFNTNVKRCKFFAYIVFTVMATSSIVATTLLLGNRYGEMGASVCWIVDRKVAVLAFSVPVLALGVSSAGLLTATFVYVKRQQVEIDRTLKQQKPSLNLPKIVLRMVLVLGVCEVIAFVRLENSQGETWREVFNSIFRVLFVTLRSFRGALICVILISGENIKKVHKTMRLFRKFFPATTVTTESQPSTKERLETSKQQI